MPTLMIVQVELGRNSDHKRDGPAVLNGAAVSRINILLTPDDMSLTLRAVL